jgi:hypothetical protein
MPSTDWVVICIPSAVSVPAVAPRLESDPSSLSQRAALRAVPISPLRLWGASAGLQSPLRRLGWSLHASVRTCRVPQLICRIRAPPRSMICERDAEGRTRCTGLVTESGQFVKAQHVLASLDYVPEAKLSGRDARFGEDVFADRCAGGPSTLRCVLLMRGSHASFSGVSLACVPPGAVGNSHAARALYLPHDTGVCPAGHSVLLAEMHVPEKPADGPHLERLRGELHACLSLLADTRELVEVATEKPVDASSVAAARPTALYMCSFLQVRRTLEAQGGAWSAVGEDGKEANVSAPENLHALPDPHAELDYDDAITLVGAGGSCGSLTHTPDDAGQGSCWQDVPWAGNAVAAMVWSVWSQVRSRACAQTLVPPKDAPAAKKTYFEQDPVSGHAAALLPAVLSQGAQGGLAALSDDEDDRPATAAAATAPQSEPPASTASDSVQTATAADAVNRDGSEPSDD